MPTRLTRRSLLRSTSAALALGALTPLRAADAAPTMGLGFSLYGMRSLALADALKTCAEIGFDSVELPVMPDWPGDSAKLTADARRELRSALVDRRLRLTALMENLPTTGDDAQHEQNLVRLRRACDLARDLAPGGDAPMPLIETILGGKAGDWDAMKDRLAGRLADWAKVLEKAQVTLAIKAHVGNATQRPEQLAWLLDKAASPYLKAAYDYSHFQLQDLPLAETVQALAPRTAFVHVKDTEHSLGKKGFLLPGEGTIDHAELFRLLSQAGYHGDIVVEVSSQVFNKPGYEPIGAARKCYTHLAAAFEKTGVKRR